MAMASAHFRVENFLVRAPEIHAAEQQPQLAFVDLLARLGGVARPGKPMVLEPLHPQAEPGAAPVQRLQDAPLPVAEHE